MSIDDEYSQSSFLANIPHMDDFNLIYDDENEDPMEILDRSISNLSSLVTSPDSLLSSSNSDFDDVSQWDDETIFRTGSNPKQRTVLSSIDLSGMEVNFIDSSRSSSPLSFVFNDDNGQVSRSYSDEIFQQVHRSRSSSLLSINENIDDLQIFLSPRHLSSTDDNDNELSVMNLFHLFESMRQKEPVCSERQEID